MANIHSVITYNANLSPAQAQIKALTGQIAGLTAAFNTLDKSAVAAQRSLATAFATNVGQIGGFTAQTVQAHNAVENFGKQLAANRLTMRQYFREAVAGYTKQNSLMKQLAAQQVRYQQSVAVPMGGGQMMMLTPATLSATGNAAAMAAQKFSIFNQLVNGGATAMLNWGKNTQWAGRQLMVGFTVPLMMFTALASKQFRDLDKELTRFQKVYGSDLGGAISESTTRMREEIQSLAFEISKTYGIAAKETAALAADIAATGKEGEDLLSSVQQTTRLAVLGEVDRQEAMKATLALQSAFRLDTNQLAESINFLNAVENQTSATLEDLATAIPKVGPVIRSLGGDVEDLATLLVAMREGGIPAAEAANALKSGLASLINPTKQASQVAKSFGIDLVGIVEANKGQLMPTIFAMRDALAGLDDFGRSRIIEQIFGKYQFARISALFDNIGRNGSQTQAVLELAAKSSTELAAVANQEIKTLTESTAVRFQRALEDLKNAIMPLGQALTETLIPIFQKIGEGFQMFAEFFKALPEPVKNFAKYGVAIAALAGPVIMLVGLFGNLIANGVKFGMMIVRLGARIAGLKVDKFELLNSEVMAAKFGVDNLTTSFTNQESAMKRLVGVMSTYETSLRRLTTANPALFIPGAIPGRGGSVPIRRQTGSMRPEMVPGSGRGDQIPALLEPGEFVVNRQATERFAPILSAMNRGNIQTLQSGSLGIQAAHTALPFAQNTKQYATAFTLLGSSARYGKDFIEFAKRFPEAIKVVSRSVALLPSQMNQALRTGMAQKDFISGWNKVGTGKFAAAAIGGGFDIRQQGATQALKKFETAVRNEAIRLAKSTKDKKVTDEVLAKAQRNVINEYKQSADSQDPVQIASKNLAGAIEKQALRLGAVRILASDQMIANNPKQFRTDASGTTYFGSLLVRREGGRDVRYNIPARLSGGITDPTAAQKSVAQKLGFNPSILSPFLTSSGGRVGAPERGTGGTGYLTTSSALKLLEREASKLGNDVSSKFITAFIQALRTNFQSASPSRRMEAEVSREGKNFGDGAALGFIKGYKSSAAGKPIIAGPVGGTGIESISNAQKIAQADQTILKLKEMQQKHTSNRVRAEVEINAINSQILANQKAYAAGQITVVQFKQKENELLALRVLEENNLRIAAAKEKFIQDKINQQKQKILDADTSQLRAEQQEAQNAQRRAATGFGVGFGGQAGYYGGGPSPYAPPTGVGSRFGHLTREERKELAALRRAGLDPTTRSRYEAGLQRRTIGQTGPGANLKDGLDRTGQRGAGMMGAAMAISMAASTITMFSGATGEAAGKLMMFTTALTTAMFTLQAMSGMGIGGKLVGGVSKLGGGVAKLGGAMGTTGIMGRMGGLLASGGTALAGGGTAAIAATAGVGAAIAVTGLSLYLYKKSLDEARERAIAAFKDPVATVEFFGKKVRDVTETLGGIQAAHASQEFAAINEQLREAVRSDYATLIEKIKNSAISVGAADLGAAYTQMLISGLTAEEALDSIKAIAAESGTAGGQAYAKAFEDGLLSSKSPEEAFNRFLEMIDPNSAYNINRVNAMQAERAAMTPTVGTRGGMGYNQQQLNQMGSVAEAMAVSGETYFAALKASIELSQTAPELVAQSSAQLREGFLNLSTAGGGLFGMGQSAQEVAFDSFKNMIGELKDPALNQIIDSLQGAPPEAQALAMELVSVGGNLNDAADAAGVFDEKLAEAAIRNARRMAFLNQEIKDTETALTDFAESAAITDQLNKTEVAIENLQNRIEKYSKSREKQKEAMDKSFEDTQEGIQNEVDSLNKQQEAIRESTDLYIDSLEKKAKADSFYSGQRKTAFSALEKLASGDVFGFLQEREQLSEQAQQFAYDKTIQGIEDRRDMELDAIDEVITKKEELMDLNEKAHQDQMDMFDKETEKHSTELEKRLQQKSKDNQEMKDLALGMAGDEIQSYKDVTEAFGIELANRYKLLVEDNIRAMALRLQEEVATGVITTSEAEKQLMDRYNALMGPGVFGTPTNRGGYGGVSSYEQLQNVLRLPTMTAALQRPGYYTVPGSTTTTTPGRTSSSGPGFDVNQWQGQNVVRGQDGENYRWDGRRYVKESELAMGGYVRRYQNGGGGKVTGPGGPKSDVIPALLSNGEYVVQASSVGKYGKDMMDSINAGKFAYGGFITADRAEQNATGTRGKPKLTGIGGGNFGRPGVDYPRVVNEYNPQDPTGLKGFVQGIRTAAATIVDSFAAPFKNPLGIRTSSDQTTALGRFIGGRGYLQSDPLSRGLSAMSVIPFGKGTATPRQELLPFTDSAGMPYKPSLSISPVQKGPAPGTVISIGRGIRGARGIAQSGKFKNMFETNTTTGSAGFEDRAAIERRGWGLPFDAAPSTRPIYGLLRKEDEVTFPYGEFLFDIKYDPAKRTSYSPGDTKWFSPPKGGLPDLKQSHTPGEGNIGYAEVWQDNVKLNDVSRAHVAITDTMDDAQVQEILSVAQMLRNKGIPVSVHGLETNLPFGQWVQRRRGQMFLPGLDKVNPYGESLMANGGLVSKYAEGGPVIGRPGYGKAPASTVSLALSRLKQKQNSSSTSGGTMPGVGGAGSPTAILPTSTSLISHPDQGGPNRWPYSGYTQASAPVPGAAVSAHLNKDVLPLFLAFASDYNRLIRPINTLYGIGSRSGNYSNHPSGTAIDINPSQEGVYFGWDWVSTDQKLAVLDWWRGRKSALAPWKSNSPVPYKTMNALMDKYKVLQWFGPRSLGGFITDEMGNSDPMHVQISQSRTVTPSEVSQTISSLGINPDGTFNAPRNLANGGFVSKIKSFATGGPVFGPGGPQSDNIPAMLSNGEYVISADSVKKYGRGFLDKINSGQLPTSIRPEKFRTGASTPMSSMRSANPGYNMPRTMSTPSFNLPSGGGASSTAVMSGSRSGGGATSGGGGRGGTSVRNNNNIRIVVNSANANAKSVANQVVQIINSQVDRREHSRSSG